MGGDEKTPPSPEIYRLGLMPPTIRRKKRKQLSEEVIDLIKGNNLSDRQVLNICQCLDVDEDVSNVIGADDGKNIIKIV